MRRIIARRIGDCLGRGAAAWVDPASPGSKEGVVTRPHEFKSSSTEESDHRLSVSPSRCL